MVKLLTRRHISQQRKFWQAELVRGEGAVQWLCHKECLLAKRVLWADILAGQFCVVICKKAM